MTARQSLSGVDSIFATNYYINSSNQDRVRTTGTSSRMFLDGDTIRFQNSPSTTVGSSPTWSERMRIDSSGSVGIGQTPAANSSYMVALQIGEQANLFAHASGVGAGSATHLSNNITHNGGYKYINADPGSIYVQASGEHSFASFAAGSAGAAATQELRMTIRSGGGIINHYRTGINVGQSATAITNASTYGGMAMIWQNYVGNIGYDLVTWTLSQVTVLASQSISGGAASRSYTAASGVLKLTMGASDTYQVYVSDITNSSA